MAEIHPNDIGLATFADVGNVQELRTQAKNLVAAVNELHANGGNISQILGTQMYVDGENNVIIGENNIVRGSNNLILGSNNIVNADNCNLIKSNRHIYDDKDVYFEYFDASTKSLSYYHYDSDNPMLTSPFNVGDKIVLKLSITWTDDNWMDYLDVSSPLYITEITDVSHSYYDNGDSYGTIYVKEMPISTEPPDGIHTRLDWTYISTSVVLTDFTKTATGSAAVIMGSLANGSNSASMNHGSAYGSSSFAANSGTADGNYSTALNSGRAHGSSSFAANSGTASGESCTAFNNGYAYSPYSFSVGYYTRIFGRPLKCTSINHSAKTLTLESGQNTNGLTGKSLMLRCYNAINTIMFPEIKIESVSGNTIYMDSDAYMGGAGSYVYTLFPDGYIFVVDNSTSYSFANFVAGYYCVAGAKYTSAQGYHTCAVHDGANIWGKYGVTPAAYSISLANGNSLKDPGLAFKALSDGSVHADGEYTSPCADYAEYFEWDDGNPNNEDRAGYFVKLKDDKIVICEEFDTPLGVVSAKPAIIGDSGEMHWKGKYITDDFGRVQYHDVVVPAEIDEDGNIIIEEHTETQPIINPEWNASEEYITRQQRPEWSTVGVLGKLVVYDDGTLKSGDLCQCGKGGKAVKSMKIGFPVLKRISDDKVLIWVK